MIDNLPSRYEIRNTCGAGRFAVVYHAFDRELQRDVALKVSDLTNREPNERLRLKRELRISCKLRHPSIASGFDGFEQGNYVVLSLPLLQGGELLTQAGNLNDSNQASLRSFIAICDAVEYVHRSGLLHADIKPENVLMDQDGKPFLTDFGSAMTIKQPTSELVGTAAYLAPELATGLAMPSIATDVYALGATLFYLLTGKPPFDGEPHAILQAIRTQPFPRVRKHNAAIDRSLEAILAVACHADPQSRYKSAADLRIDVERFLDDQPIAARNVGSLGRAWLLAKRNPTSAGLIAALVAVVLVGTVGSTIGWIRSDSQRRSLDQSTIVFAKQSKQAAEHETSLQGLLATINAEQKSIEAATANEVKFRAEAETARDQALQASQLAKVRLLEAQKLSSMADALKNSSGEIDSQIVRTDRLIQEQAAFNTERQIRSNATNAMISTCKAIEQRQWDDAGKFLAAIPINHRDSSYQRLSKIVTKHTHGVGFVPIVNSRPNARRIVFSRDASKAILLSHQSVEIVEFDNNGVPASTCERYHEAFMGDRAPQTAAFNATGNDVAIAYQSTSTKHAVVLRYVHNLRSDNRVFEMEFKGEISAIRINDQNDIFVIRSNHTTNDVEIYDVKSAKVVWSWRDSLKQSSEQGSLIDNAPLLPLFIEVGTKPWEHVLFVSTPKPESGVHTRVFLHSVDLRSAPIIKSYDCGLQDLGRWPHRWYVSEHVTYGLGQKCLSTQDPPLITNARYANVDRQLGKQDQFTLSKCANGWQPIANRPEIAFKSSYLEASLFFDWFSPPFSANVQSNTPESRIPTPWLDLFSGRVSLNSGSDSGFVFDLIGQQRLSIPLMPNLQKANSYVAIGSDQGNRVIAINGDRIQACSAYDWNPEAFHSVDVMNERLAKVAGRLKDAANAGEPLLANSQTIGANNSSESGIRPSGGYLVCQSGSDGFEITGIKIDDRSAITFEAVVNMDAIKRSDYPTIVGSNIGLALKFDPKSLDFFLENRLASGTSQTHWAGVHSGPVPTNQWVHVAACFDGVDRFSLYVDGKLRTTNKVDYKPNTDRTNSNLVVNAYGSLFAKLDAVRVSNGQRYTNDFVPILPMSTDESTVALYQFDEPLGNTVIDSSGNSNHGWIEHPGRANAIKKQFTYGGPAKPIAAEGYALRFDQLNHLVVVKDFEVKEFEPITVETIIRLDEQAPEKNFNAIVVHPQFEIKASPSRQISFGHQTRWGERTVFNDVVCNAFIHNRWVHIAGCWDGDKSVSLFIDGSFVGKQEIEDEQTNLPTMGNIHIGAYSSRRAFGGYVDSLRISKGVRNFDRFDPTIPFATDEDTMLLLDFNEGQGLVMNDQSGGAHHATSTNADWVLTQDLKDEPIPVVPVTTIKPPGDSPGPTAAGINAPPAKKRFQAPNRQVKPGYHRLTLVGRDVDVHELSISIDGIRSVGNKYSWPSFEVNGARWEPENQKILSEIDGQKLVPVDSILGASDIEIVYVPEYVLPRYHVTNKTIEIGFVHPPRGVGDCCVIIDIPLTGTIPADAIQSDVKWLTDWDAKFYSYFPKKNNVRPDMTLLQPSSALGGFKTSSSQFIFNSRLLSVTEEIAKKFPADYSVIAAQRRFQAANGTYRLETVADDGIRVWVDDELRIDNWQGQTATQKVQDFKLSEGSHSVRFEYFDVNSWSGLYVHLRRLR